LASPEITMTLRCLALGRLLRLLCSLALAAIAAMATAAEPPIWIDHDAAGARRVHLYFFWTRTCPHCQAARPFVDALPARHAWLVVHSHDLTADQDAADRYVTIAESLGEDASSVPAFLFCGRMEVGFDRPETSGRALEDALQSCRQAATRDHGDPHPRSAAGARPRPARVRPNDS
jgi:thiol-disulfide isomerase/thioredoxin